MLLSSFYLFGICILYSCHPSRSLLLGPHYPPTELPYFIVNIENPSSLRCIFFTLFFYFSLPSLPLYQTFEGEAGAVTRFFLSFFLSFFLPSLLSFCLFFLVGVFIYSFNKNGSEHKRMGTDRKVRSMVYTVETSFVSFSPFSNSIFCIRHRRPFIIFYGKCIKWSVV